MGKLIKVAATGARCGALPQGALASEVDAAVIAYLDSVFARLRPQNPDIIVLPEMCDLPEDWSMAAYVQYISTREEAVLAYIREKAKEQRVWIAFSTVRKMVPERYRTCCILVDRHGDTAMIYDKMHPTLGELEVGIEPGDAPRVLECEFGRVGFAICFDLNYLELAQEYQRQKVNLLLFPSLFHGGLLQKLWAFTARAYFIGACGGCGASVVSPMGDVLQTTTGDCLEAVQMIPLDFALVHLDFNAEKLEQIGFKYANEMRVYNPGELGSVMLSGEIDELSVKSVLQEFNMETLDEYLQRAKCAKTT